MTPKVLMGSVEKRFVSPSVNEDWLFVKRIKYNNLAFLKVFIKRIYFVLKILKLNLIRKKHFFVGG